MFLLIKRLGVPVCAITDAALSELEQHVRSGYPELLEDLAAGSVTGEEVAVLPAMSGLPVTDSRLAQRLLAPRPLVTYLFELENRIRDLEALPRVNAEQFRQVLRTRLGL